MSITTHTVTFIEEATDERHEVQAVEGEPLLEAAQSAALPIESECGGVCSCTTCQVYIEEGDENLSEQAAEEADMLEMSDYEAPESRLSCQALVYGPVTATILAEVD
jgi:2Fe-2S ferredoxin